MIHNAKLSKSFNSARWKRGYNTDLIFVSESIANMCGKSVMEPMPHTQHCPIFARANPVVVAHPTPLRRHFKLRKADWDGYSTEPDKLKTLNPSQETMLGWWTRYVWLQKGIFHEDVEQTLYPVHQKNHRSCMKSTRNNMQATLLTMIP